MHVEQMYNQAYIKLQNNKNAPCLHTVLCMCVLQKKKDVQDTPNTHIYHIQGKWSIANTGVTCLYTCIYGHEDT